MYKVYVATVFFGTLIPFYPIFRYLLAQESRWEACFVWQVRWGKVVRFLSGIRLKVTGLEHLPAPPFVVVANHASYIDTFLMYGIIPHFFVFMGMAELKNYPMFGRFFTSGQNIAVNRSNLVESAKAFQLAEEKLAKGTTIALFPEGGILTDGPNMAPFKNGAFKMAVTNGVPIVPMVMLDTHKIVGSTNVFTTMGWPGTAKVKILPPLETSHYTLEELPRVREKIREQMQHELNQYYLNE